MSMKMNATTMLVAGLCLSILNWGCASQEVSVGQAMTAHSDQMAQHGKNWEKGNKMNTKGLQMVERAKKKVDESHADSEKGQALMEEGGLMIKSSRTDYAKLQAQPKQVSAPKDIEVQINELRRIARQWAKGLSKVEDGQALMTEALEEKEQAMTNLKKGNALILEGTQLMHKSESHFIEHSPKVGNSQAGG